MTRLGAALVVVVVVGCGSGSNGAMDLAVVVDDLATPVTADLSFPIRDFARAIPDGATVGEIGWPCDVAGQCHGGLCVDGYCCESLCNDAASFCKACNVPGAEGRCVLTPSGTDPHGVCNADPVNGCGHDGLCDGNGQCRLYLAGTVCGLPSCASDQITYEPVCDGVGHCVPSAPVSCAPYGCQSTSACYTACSGGATGCKPPATCSNFSCGPRALGQPCIGPGDCATGFCAQGVCCDASCGAACQACNLPGSEGHCSTCNASHKCNLSTGACL